MREPGDVATPHDEKFCEVPGDVSWYTGSSLEPREQRVRSEPVDFYLACENTRQPYRLQGFSTVREAFHRPQREGQRRTSQKALQTMVQLSRRNRQSNLRGRYCHSVPAREVRHRRYVFVAAANTPLLTLPVLSSRNQPPDTETRRI